MATMWRKAMLYLGLGPDEEYDDYDAGYDDPAPSRPAPRPGAAASPSYPGGGGSSYPDEGSAVRPLGPSRPAEPQSDFASQVGAAGGIGAVTPAGGLGGRSRTTVVRPMPVASSARPRLVVPASFNQAQELADTFKGNQPVVMNLRHADREVARRLIDFSSGLCYGLGGRMEKLDGQVYLLSPANIEVTEDERTRLRDRGYED
jgi:cell division inhibitor SepF